MRRQQYQTQNTKPKIKTNAVGLAPRIFATVIPILAPFFQIRFNIMTDFVQIGFISNNVVVIIALPDFFKWVFFVCRGRVFRPVSRRVFRPVVGCFSRTVNNMVYLFGRLVFKPGNDLS